MKHTSPVRVAVVIPVYKPKPTEHEIISLTQCLRILGKHTVYLVAPHSLDISYYREFSPTLQSKTFDNSYFSDIQGYNRLMLSEQFYGAFTDVEYILIHQLDAFVFDDKLDDWCRQGYDYIGAPWLRDRDFTSWQDKLSFQIKQRIATWLDLKKDDGVTPREIVSLNEVGNGGLSLRRIPAMLRCLQQFGQKIDEYERLHHHQYNEDVFWGIEVNRYWPRLRIPSYRKALHFSVEFFPKWAIEHYNNGQLPFGCHAWDIHETAYWRVIFARYGYKI
ncbi:DUF5672 family protein [Spirosoma utsteinense]|uniref:DUF5672 domain-containing protein n=1 Tax=Spirosoma utsteinense TaxID=2585773 RepID=A0ABR6W5Y6_9BACT|nr:DUF5672 family protein [Spirosoma utsteinense]MBC3786329.1 hypothetical protein [Spirosoma utsteinense]MBC3791955.1 hypothetical protein [Spirosoma utsteinense]